MDISDILTQTIYDIYKTAKTELLRDFALTMTKNFQPKTDKKIQKTNWEKNPPPNFVIKKESKMLSFIKFGR